MHRALLHDEAIKKLISANKGNNYVKHSNTIARQYSGRTLPSAKCWQTSGHSLLRPGRLFRSLPKKAAFIPLCSRMKKKKHDSLRAFLTGGFKNASPLSPKAQVSKDDNLFRYQAKIIRQLAEESSCVIIRTTRRPYPCRCSRRCPCLCPRPKIFVCRKQ